MTLARRASRLAVAAAAVAGVALGGATPSGAHNSRTAFTGVFGPYDVVGTVRYVHEASVHGVTLDLNVRTEGSRRPVERAAVLVEGHAGERTVGPLDAERYGSTYRVVLPGGDVEHWEIETSIDGPPGPATFTRTVPGPVELRDITDAGSGHGDGAGGLWTATTVGALVLVGAGGLTRWWRPVMRASGLVLLVACGAALVGSWSDATAPTAAKVLALLAPLVAAGLLVAGLVTTRDRRDESLLLVFAGAAGLAVLFGWMNRSFLAGDVSSTLPPTLARTCVALALATGGGLALLVMACHRDKLRALVPLGGR
ncbi:MAG: hypothetical protein ACLFXM_11665 [Acidimicrobiia bacterium]